MTTPSQPPESEQPPNAPRPGVRMRAPGAAPSLPEEVSEPRPTTGEGIHPEEQLAPPAPTPDQAETPPPTRRKGRLQRVREAVESSAGQRQPSDPSETIPSTKGRTRPPPIDRPKLIDKAELAGDLTNLFQAAGEKANERLAPGTPLYIAADAEARGVAEPVASILDRHLPNAVRDPDARDAFAAAITLVRYAVRQIRLRAEIRRRLDAGSGEEPAEQRPAA